MACVRSLTYDQVDEGQHTFESGLQAVFTRCLRGGQAHQAWELLVVTCSYPHPSKKAESWSYGNRTHLNRNSK